jgi:hypothetical protein
VATVPVKDELVQVRAEVLFAESWKTPSRFLDLSERPRRGDDILASRGRQKGGGPDLWLEVGQMPQGLGRFSASSAQGPWTRLPGHTPQGQIVRYCARDQGAGSRRSRLFRLAGRLCRKTTSGRAPRGRCRTCRSVRVARRQLQCFPALRPSCSLLP